MTRRVLSWPVFLLSVAAVAAAAGSYRALHGWQLTRLSHTLLHRAEAEEKEEAWRKAADHLERYVRLNPASDKARIRLASVVSRGAKNGVEKQRAVELHYRALT